MDFWEAENSWYWNAPVSRLSKAIAQWEIYKTIIELPGEIAEFGTYKAASLIRLATFREIAESAHSRKILAFDAFGAFPLPGNNDARSDDAAFVARFNAEGGEGLSEEATSAILRSKGFTNVELVAGDIVRTLPAYLARFPETRFALVHVDVDLHAITRLVLDLTSPLLVLGGVFMLDDYGKVAGASAAVDEFIADNPSFILKRTPLSYAPSVLREVERQSTHMPINQSKDVGDTPLHHRFRDEGGRAREG